MSDIAAPPRGAPLRARRPGTEEAPLFRYALIGVVLVILTL